MSSRTQTLLASVGVALVLLLFFLLFIRSRQSDLGRVKDQVQAEQDRTQQLRAELAGLEALQANAPKLQATLDEVRRLVPQNNEVANFIFQVQQAADQAGVGFVQITPELPKPPPEGAQLAEVRATIGAKGGYFAIQDFLRRLYDLDRAVRVDNLAMTGNAADQAGATAGSISVTLAARIFFETPAAAAPATAPGAPTTPTTPATPAPAPAAAPAP